MAPPEEEAGAPTIHGEILPVKGNAVQAPVSRHRISPGSGCSPRVRFLVAIDKASWKSCGGTGGGGGGGGVGPGSNEEHWCYKITYCGANQPTVEECGPLDEPEPLCESNNFEVTCTSTWHCIKLS